MLQQSPGLMIHPVGLGMDWFVCGYAERGSIADVSRRVSLLVGGIVSLQLFMGCGFRKWLDAGLMGFDCKARSFHMGPR